MRNVLDTVPIPFFSKLKSQPQRSHGKDGKIMCSTTRLNSFELSFEPLTLQRNLARADTEMFMRPFTFHLGAALSIVILKQLHAASLQLPCSFRWYTYHSDSWDECEHEGAASQQKETPDLLI